MRTSIKRLVVLSAFAFPLTTFASATTVTLAWDACSCTNVITNYTIYYGPASRVYTNTVDAGTNLTVSISNLLANASYYFAATATDEQGLTSDYSDEASMEVPTIVTQPQDARVRIGTTATFNIVAAGTAPLGYQWLFAGTNVVGATAASWSYMATVAQTNTVGCVVSNIYGQVASGNAFLYATGAVPVITVQPVSRSVVIGNPAPFSVTATGDGTLSYQWSLGGTNIAGATGLSWTYTPNVIGTNQVLCVVTNVYGQVTSSNGVYLYATGIAPSITAQPQNQTVSVGNPATFSVTATGSGTLRYQWARGGTNATGATASAWTFTPGTPQTNAIRCTITNLWGQVITTNAYLYASGAAPVITVQPQSRTVLVGNLATFSVTATGTAPLSYQWSMGGTNASGATALTWSYVPSAAGTNTVRCAVTNLYGSALSAGAILAATNAPATNVVIITIPAWAKRIMFMQ
jgi:hypothetical protein